MRAERLVAKHGEDRRKATAAALSRAFAQAIVSDLRRPVSPHPLPRHADETSCCDAMLTTDCASGGCNLELREGNVVTRKTQASSQAFQITVYASNGVPGCVAGVHEPRWG